MILKYLEVIPVLHCELREQLWDIPQRRESFTCISAKVISENQEIKTNKL